MKIDEERQELILSDGRRIDMYSVERFLENFTNRDDNSYLVSKDLFDKQIVEDLDEIDECRRSLPDDDNGNLATGVRKLITECDRLEMKMERMKINYEEAKEFRNRVKEFIIEWGTFLKNIDSSLSLDDSQRLQVESVTDVLFDFDFNNLEDDEDIPF